MKKFSKKILALALAAVMVFAMSVTAFAADEEPETVTITVNRDDSYAGEEDAAGRTFTWYKIFTAVPAEDFESSNASGHEDGVANVATGDGQVSYYATAAVAAKLGTWVAATGTPGEEGYVAAHWEAADDDINCFILTPIAGSTEYTVTWNEDVTVTADTLQAAAKWLVDNGAYEDTGDMTFANGKWTADVEIGYYVISSDTGDNVIAATTDITVNEKNDYPPITKEQVDEDLADQPITEVEDVGDLEGHVGEDDDPVNVAIGDVVAYKVTVTIPAAAKVGETIEVWDKNSTGLTYNDDLVFDPEDDVTDGTVGTGECWHKIITVTAENKGTDVVFEYSMTINKDALVDVGRQNEAGLKYGDNYESLPHSVNYTTYFTGIEKTDGEEPLEGVKFDLFEAGVAFNVTKTDAGYYIPGGDSNEVVTDEDGLILIRGLDGDKTYTLTETETLPGFNMLEEDVTLVLVEDTPAVEDDPATTDVDESKDASFDSYDPDNYQDVINNSGTVLPSTGGMGTTILYIVGGVVVAAALVLLITKRRMRKEEY